MVLAVAHRYLDVLAFMSHTQQACERSLSVHFPFLVKKKYKKKLTSAPQRLWSSEPTSVSLHGAKKGRCRSGVKLLPSQPELREPRC